MQGVTFLRHALAFAAQKDDTDQLLLLAALFDDVNKSTSSELAPLIKPEFNVQQNVDKQEKRRSRLRRAGKETPLSRRQRATRKGKGHGTGHGKGKDKSATRKSGGGSKDTAGPICRPRRGSAIASEEKQGNFKIFSSRNDSAFDSLSQSSFNRP